MMKQILGREVARQFLTRKYGDDRFLLSVGDETFSFVRDRQILTIYYVDVPADIRAEAEAVIRLEQSAA